MAAAHSATKAPAKHELIITRVFDAPRSLVFKAWTKPEHLVRWLGPRDFTAPSVKMDFRPGGAYRHCIRSPEGKEYWMRGVYREIVEPERIAFTFSWEEEGERGRENMITVTFADHNGKTKLTFRQAFFESVEQRDSHHGGWSECLDRLAAYVAGA
ncbi:MAG: SRPBCC domain-containing protein [Dongiaceae bacterium]